MLIAPETTDVVVFLLRDEPQNPDRLQVVRERSGRATREVVEMDCHGVPPAIPVASSGSTVVSLDARRSAAMRRASK